MNEGRNDSTSSAAQLLQRLDPATRTVVEAAAASLRMTPAGWLDLRVIQASGGELPVELEAPSAPPPQPAPPLPKPATLRVTSALDGLRGRGAGRTTGRGKGTAGRFAPRLAEMRRRVSSHPLVHHRVLGQRTVLAGAVGLAVLIGAAVWLMQPAADRASSVGTSVQLPAAAPQAGGTPLASVPNVAPPAGGPAPAQPGAATPAPDSAAALAAAAFREKAEKGDAMAQHDLGVLYADGRGVARNYAEAARWFRKSAEAGIANAQFNLAVLTERGLGVTRDAAEAARLYRQAAEQGHAGAQYNLGIVLAEGRGVPQDYAEAGVWFRRAANQGFAKAAYNLGVVYERGLTGAVDDVEAYRWYARALESGDADAKERMDLIAKRLTPQDLNQARQRPTGSVDPALVADVQRLLTARGYKPGAADGSFGERTADAIRRFQRDQGYPQDGKVTPELLRQLEGAPSNQ